MQAFEDQGLDYETVSILSEEELKEVIRSKTIPNFLTDWNSIGAKKEDSQLSEKQG